METSIYFSEYLLKAWLASIQVFELSGWMLVYVKRAILFVQRGNAGLTQTQRKHPGAAYKECLLWEAGNIENVAEVHSLDSSAYRSTQGCTRSGTTLQWG